MTGYPIVPHPFTPPKSFFDVGIGTEKLELKPEWRDVYGQGNRQGRKRREADNLQIVRINP